MNQEMLRAAPRMLARAAPRAAPRMAANRMVHANRARASGKPFRNNFNEQMKLKESQPQLRQVEEGTKQYSETHYYSFKGVPGLASKSLVRAHHFWADAALWASEHGGSFDGFLASSWVTQQHPQGSSGVYVDVGVMKARPSTRDHTYDMEGEPAMCEVSCVTGDLCVDFSGWPIIYIDGIFASFLLCK